MKLFSYDAVIYSNDFSQVNYIIDKLKEGIDTTYLPIGNNIGEIISSFTKIQLSRSFTPGYSSALLKMSFNENVLCIGYESTSGTEVDIDYYFDSNMSVDRVLVEVSLPDYKASSKGFCYNAITKSFYEGYGDFFEFDVPSNSPKGNMVLKVPSELKVFNRHMEEIPIPKWVYHLKSNYEADIDFESYGYRQIIPAIGYEEIWYNPQMHYEYFVRKAVSSWKDNAWFVLRTPDSRVMNHDSLLSYLDITEILEKRVSKIQVETSRRLTKVISEVEHEYDEEYVEVLPEEEE